MCNWVFYSETKVISDHTLLAFGITIDKLPGKLFFYNRCQTLFEIVWNMFEIGLVVLAKKDM